MGGSSEQTSSGRIKGKKNQSPRSCLIHLETYRTTDGYEDWDYLRGIEDEVFLGEVNKYADSI